MANHRYRVERHMTGDKAYEPGDERELAPGEAAHLVASGALTDLGPVKGEKAEPELQNKADAPAKKKAASE